MLALTWVRDGTGRGGWHWWEGGTGQGSGTGGGVALVGEVALLCVWGEVALMGWVAPVGWVALVGCVAWVALVCVGGVEGGVHWSGGEDMSLLCTTGRVLALRAVA